MSLSKLPFSMIIIAFTFFSFCTQESSSENAPADSLIISITSVEHFNTILENSGNKLLAFDLSANWCIPCGVLEPILSELASEQSYRVTMYKVDTDKFPQITTAFGVTGIPFVVFVKNQRALYALVGVQPKDSYLEIIQMYADSNNNHFNIQPENQSYEGLRVNSKSKMVNFENTRLSQYHSMDTLLDFYQTTTASSSIARSVFIRKLTIESYIKNPLLFPEPFRG